MDTLFSRFHRNIQTLIWKYDAWGAAVISHLPSSLHNLSAAIGRATLPLYWAALLAGISFLLLPVDAHLSLAGFASLICMPLATILKLVVRRSRPKTLYAQQMKIKSYSFPSSHAYSATIASGYLAILSFAILPGLVGYVLASAWIVFIFVIGVSRVHIGAHYPTDVTAGWLLGITILYAISHLVV